MIDYNYLFLDRYTCHQELLTAHFDSDTAILCKSHSGERIRLNSNRTWQYKCVISAISTAAQ